jgi:hypothetical protein
MSETKKNLLNENVFHFLVISAASLALLGKFFLHFTQHRVSRPHKDSQIASTDIFVLTFNLTYLCWPREESTRQAGGVSRCCSVKKDFGSHTHLADILHMIQTPKTNVREWILIISHNETVTIRRSFAILIEHHVRELWMYWIGIRKIQGWCR